MEKHTEWYGFLASLWGGADEGDGVFLVVDDGTEEGFTPAFCPAKNINKAPPLFVTEMVTAYEQATDDKIAVVTINSKGVVKPPTRYVSKNTLRRIFAQRN